jgi:Icc-related predicted phosphoesterase
VKILLYSDIHSDLAALRRLMAIEADAYFCAGDLVNMKETMDAAGEILRPKADRTYIIPGNHESADQIAEFAKEYGLTDLHSRSVTLDGVHLAALGYSNITPFNTPGEYTETEIADRLAPFTDLKPLVLICHCPPKDTPLDRAGEGLHFGSPAVRTFIDQHQPARFYCGHIHEAAGIEAQLGQTPGLNIGKRGHLLDLSTIRQRPASRPVT